jgi:hypothetical protein
MFKEILMLLGSKSRVFEIIIINKSPKEMKIFIAKCIFCSLSFTTWKATQCQGTLEGFGLNF